MIVNFCFISRRGGVEPHQAVEIDDGATCGDVLIKVERSFDPDTVSLAYVHPHGRRLYGVTPEFKPKNGSTLVMLDPDLIEQPAPVAAETGVPADAATHPTTGASAIILAEGDGGLLG